MMKKVIKVNYPIIENFGDILNQDIIKEVFGYKINSKDTLTSEMCAIGSGLGGFLYSGSLKHRIKQFVYGNIFYPDLHVWGTGFISYKQQQSSFFHKNMCFHAVRGELTKKRVETILGKSLDIPTGDGGLLSSFLLKEMPKKKYEIGIIAHFKEQDEPEFAQLRQHFQCSTFIDVKRSPLEVIQKIAECDCIISSSLHGLIVADSLRIPNLHIKVSSKLMGDGYKFDDYYSSYNIPHKYIKLSNDSIPSKKQILEGYAITDEMVNTKKKDLIQAFPFKCI